MHKDFLAYAFYKCAKGEYNDDGTVFVNERAANFQPLREWDALLAIVAFDPSYTVSAYSNKPCGHLGVRDALGKCLQCSMARDAVKAARERERDDVRTERVRADNAERERVQKLRDEIGQVEQECRDIELRIADLQRELTGRKVRLGALRSEIARGAAAKRDDTLAGSSRKHAMAIGATWYHPSTPCKYCGGFGLRYVANGRCKDCGSVKR